MLDALEVADKVFPQIEGGTARLFCKYLHKTDKFSKSASPGVWDMQMHVFSGGDDKWTKDKLCKAATYLREELVRLVIEDASYKSLDVKGIKDRVIVTESAVKDALDASTSNEPRLFDPGWKREELAAHPNATCAVCNESLGRCVDEIHADHIKPFSKGGRTSKSNMQLLHRRCNLQKGAK